MSTLAFEATNEDGTPRKYAGMHRPDPSIYTSGYIHCACGTILQTQQQLREHWQQGHLDRALYEVPA